MILDTTRLHAVAVTLVALALPGSAAAVGSWQPGLLAPGADLASIACFTYEMFSTAHALPGETVRLATGAVADDRSWPFPSVSPPVPGPIARAVEHCHGANRHLPVFAMGGGVPVLRPPADLAGMRLPVISNASGALTAAAKAVLAGLTVAMALRGWRIRRLRHAVAKPSTAGAEAPAST
jgi:hypothetical protein